MNRFFRLTFMEYLYSLKRIITEFWWVYLPILFIIMALFTEKPDLAARLFLVAFMCIGLKAIFGMMEMREAQIAARENRAYDEEKEFSVGPMTDKLDIPTNIRLQHSDPNWGERIVRQARDREMNDDLPPADPRVLRLPAFLRWRKKTAASERE